MILELTGSRILAPHVGGSLPVWTSLIGIILGSLSAGYMLGGKLADKTPTYPMLGAILFLSALSLCIIPAVSMIVIPLFLVYIRDVRIGAVVSSLLLFVIPSILLGMVSPYAIRLKLVTVITAGRTAGRLYAISTIGSIFGTFLAGFYLFSVLGSSYIVYLLSVVLFILSCFIWTPFIRGNSIVFLLFVSASIGINFLYVSHSRARAFETPYNSVLILDGIQPQNKRPIRVMKIGNKIHSGMYLDAPELLYQYTKIYHLADFVNPHISQALMIGGAGYSYPKDFIRYHQDAHMDVVEIDPGLTFLAEKYFDFKSTNNITVYHEDARTFINREKKHYDVIFSDAFASTNSLPFQLATKEAISNIYTLLTSNGVFLSDSISAITGEKGKLFRAQYHTYASVFPYVYVFPADFPSDGDKIQNTILVASKKPIHFSTSNPEYRAYFSHEWNKKIPKEGIIFTDDYAPIEQYAMNLL